MTQSKGEANAHPDDGPIEDSRDVPEKDIATAYHEAGHAVVALSVGRTIQKLSIVRNSMRLGVVNLGSGRSGRRQDYFESEALILLAGVISEARVTGELNWGGARQDMSLLRRLIASRVATDQAAEKLERRLFDKTEHLLMQEGIWSAVEKLAKLLIEHGSMSGRAARHVFDEATKES